MSKSGQQFLIRLRSKPSGAWFVHPDLREKLIADAAAQETNLTAVATGILAEIYKIVVVSNGRRTTPVADADTLKLWLPEKLIAKLDNAAAARRRLPGFPRSWTAQDEARAALSSHYSLPLPAKVKPQRRRRSAPASA